MPPSSAISPSFRATPSFNLRAPVFSNIENSASLNEQPTSPDVADDASQGSGKRRRLTTSDFTRRKRAVTACQFCRMRKTKCDNVRPKCGYCVRQRAKCVYGDTDEIEADGEDAAVSNRQLMEQLVEIKEMLQRNEGASHGHSDTDHSLAAATSPQAQAATSPWARFSANTPRPNESKPPGFPFEALRCESLLRWPALRSVVPGDAQDIDSFPLSSGYTESTLQNGGGGQGINESAFVPLCRKFLSQVHPRNPVLDGHELMRHARSAEEDGLKWDSSSCLVLLACALASYTDMWRRPNEYPIPPTPEQLGSFADSQERAKAEPYYAAAQKRMGLLGNTIQDIQCYFFATIFEKFALRPLRAWCYIQQACSRLETRLLQRGERPWTAFRDTSPEDYHLEQRLFWSCFRAESELVFELGLRPSSLENFSYPQPFPTPPEGLLSDFSPATDGSSVGPDEEQRQVDERGWCYYLSEISIRRTVDETLNLLYRHGEGYWMKNPAHLVRQYHECEQQIALWKYHLPSVVQFDDDVLPDEEFAAALQGRASLWREYTLRPILFYVLHHNPEEPIHPEAEALAAKEIRICATMVHRMAFHRRHGGTWLIARKSFMAACIVIAAAANSHRVSPPEEWHTLVGIAIQSLERWAGEASDLQQMADILVYMYRETCSQRGEPDMMALE
ncbi:hypothetical protein B0J15DRAFT_531018 [Fusarium solani]|uniref:Zn(2)-C6 fungal-type domain-containing protein n=1 Tax=Fusarium solani TaxID=169388 RepID=A0A9P9RDL3_FUSSL|nr:uncharacterized protein B0J15DRAFT_531018 [Fusarium solani]KAH7274929.1 hypothetical protein B0J15DRAFT_531018 [Fusarium solani]